MTKRVIGVFITVAAALTDCDQGKRDPGQECWAHVYRFGPLGILADMGFNKDCSCYEIGELDGQTIYRCPCTRGCFCGYEPPDGKMDTWGCRWEKAYYYEGPETSWWPIGSCTCLANFPCWQRCCGYSRADGELSCEVDGSVIPCRSEPELDENGTFVLCELGVGNRIPYDSYLTELEELKKFHPEIDATSNWCR